MKRNCRIFISFIVLLLSSCTVAKVENDFLGFWEGPHPDDINKKFYIQVKLNNDSLVAEGFWTFKNLYSSEFQVESVSVNSDSIQFFIPNWNCYYSGKLLNSHIIKGGFSCEGDAFDSVNLIQNNEIQRFLTEAKEGCLSPDYKYKYEPPALFENNISSSHFESSNDSLFIYSIISEIINNKYGRINAFLLLKQGKLICEEYFYGYTANDLHQIESSTKSITSLLIGIAKDKGMLADIQEPLYKIFPDYPHLKTGDYSQITIEHLLTMTSGFSPEYEPYKDYDRIAHALKRKLMEKPGKKFLYDGGNTEILGAVIKTKTGMFADAFAEKYLFKPLGVKKYNWDTFKQNGFPCLGGSLQLTPRDMLKIGSLILNNGRFNNQQVISEEWIKESTAIKTKTHIEGDNYAYHWWDISLKSNNTTYESIWANGMGSQFIYIIPTLDVVIVTTGYNYENDSWVITEGISKYLYLLDN